MQPSSPAASGGWMDELAAQQYVMDVMDPRIYSHSGASTQYPGNPYGATMSTAYPTSIPQGSCTNPNTLYPSAYSHQQQTSQWQPTTSTSHDPYSAQHTSLNANPGSAPVFLYPPSHVGPPAAYSGSFTPPHSAAYPDPESDADDPPERDASSRTPDWSQQSTMQGTPRGRRIAVPCDTCRVRKMKCDGARPACSNCRREAHQSVEYEPEPEPRRRGPDQGQRVRPPLGQRKPRKSRARQGREDTLPESSGYRW